MKDTLGHRAAYIVSVDKMALLRHCIVWVSTGILQCPLSIDFSLCHRQWLLVIPLPLQRSWHWQWAISKVTSVMTSLLPNCINLHTGQVEQQSII